MLIQPNLLEIKKRNIGAEKIDSVNARDLHVALHVKKDFSNWIKSQIKNLGLEENIDYLTLALKGDGGKFGKIEYHITSDATKHISMASRTEKGRAVRNYFIAIEKEHKKTFNPNRINGYKGLVAKLQKEIEKQNYVIDMQAHQLANVEIAENNDDFCKVVHRDINSLFFKFQEQSAEFKNVADYAYAAHKRTENFLYAFKNYIINNKGVLS